MTERELVNVPQPDVSNGETSIGAPNVVLNSAPDHESTSTAPARPSAGRQRPGERRAAMKRSHHARTGAARSCISASPLAAGCSHPRPVSAVTDDREPPKLDRHQTQSRCAVAAPAAGWHPFWQHCGPLEVVGDGDVLARLPGVARRDNAGDKAGWVALDRIDAVIGDVDDRCAAHTLLILIDVSASYHGSTILLIYD